MGSFLFKWEHPASEVYVTGTFDDWKKTEKLEKVDEHFEKNVKLEDASKKIFYKFVVDGNWVTDHTVPKEVDESGNENNVLTPDRIVAEAPATTAIMSSAAPDSTTAALAADVPLEKKTEGEELPGTFPETPAASAPAEADKGGDFSVNPLPATVGAVNPITLAPGEKVPENLAAAAPTDNVKLDPESYEKSDTLPGGVPAVLSSAAPESTTAALAASAPIETKVPEVVKESQEKADAEPEASAVPEEVKEKAAVEDELLEKVKEAPSTSEGTAGEGTEKTEKAVTPGEAAASVVAAATAVGGAAVAGAVVAKDAAVEKATGAASAVQTSIVEAAANLPEPIKEQLPESVQNAIADTAKEETREEVSPEVPAEVKESITEAGKAPEAAANTEAVEDKKAVEAELLKEVKPVEAVEEQPKSEPTESKDAAGESSEIQVPAAAESAVTNGANGTNGTNGTQETVKPVEVKPTEATEPTTPATPADAAASSNAKTDGSASVEKKKKNRLSTLFGKVKSKLSSK